jgi:hypothetical protein
LRGELIDDALYVGVHAEQLMCDDDRRSLSALRGSAQIGLHRPGGGFAGDEDLNIVHILYRFLQGLGFCFGARGLA